MQTPRLVAAALAAATAAAALCGVWLAGDEPPDAPRDVITGPVSEFGTRMAACLTAAGWDAAATPSNSFEVTADATERAQVDRDKADCGRRLGYDVYGNSAK